MQIFSRNKYLYYTFYLFYCQSRISFLCNLSRNICEILRFFRRKFQKSVLFFSFITKSPGKWGFLLKNVSEMSQNIFRYMLYTLFSQYFILILFEYTFFIIARQPSVWHPPFSGLFLFSAFYVHREVFSH